MDPFICCKFERQCCCIEDRCALPCDEDLPMECGCFGYFCMGEGPAEAVKDGHPRGWKAFKPDCGGASVQSATTKEANPAASPPPPPPPQ